MKKIFMRIFAFIILVNIIYLLGPRPSLDQDYRFNPQNIPLDIENYLKTSEHQYDDIVKGAEKEIIWANEDKQKTEIALIYIHGFSATRAEIEPVTSNVAKALNANIFFTRLKGHGRPGEEMGNVQMVDWLNDTAEAIEIGKRIGERVILISTSTGSALSTWAASHPKLSEDIDGLVLISANYAIHAAPTWQLTMPWGQQVIEMVAGKERGRNCNLSQAERLIDAKWTACYPTKALTTMGAIMRTVTDIDKSTIKTPALFIYSTEDKVVKPKAIEKVISDWGGEKQIYKLSDTSNNDNHVITGDYGAPETTADITQTIIKWINNQ